MRWEEMMGREELELVLEYCKQSEELEWRGQRE